MARGRWLFLMLMTALTVALGWSSHSAGALWPPVVALAVIVVFRQALWGLVAGALAGAVLLKGGNPVPALIFLLPDHLLPGLTSPWKIGAVAFTLILGGFAAVLEEGGGFTTLLRRLSNRPDRTGRRLETAAAGLGLLCFFDGLANSMLVGRVGRQLADRAGVARVKLAYIADSTSSAVACLAIISTWIAFQLSMIDTAFAQIGHEVNPYAVFLASLPLNFYCWFTLVMLWAAIRQRFHPGPMAAFDREATARIPATSSEVQGGPLTAALVPLAVLIIAFLAGFVVLGTEGSPWPMTRDRLVAAFGSDAGPLVMVAAAVMASLAALLLFPRLGEGRWKPGLLAFGRGFRAMVLPVFILVAAWMLGSVINGLGTAELIASLAQRGGQLAWVPSLVFITGALVSFATGTSWGTMGLLFPLTIPAAASLGATEPQLHLVVAAVFSGAVFGDHCSPFSDTTIVTSISCGVDPHDHVRTQLPYALLTAAAAVFLGFLPAGYGAPGWLLLLLGSAAILVLPRIWPPPRSAG
jgi:Na+/H+ antiporter NhaC